MGDGNVLGRLRDGESTQEVVRDRVSFFSVVSTTKGPRLLLHMVSLDPRMVTPMSLLDPATGEERSLVSAWWTLSWDGQWAVGRELDSRRRLILVDLTTGTSEPIEFSTDVGQPEWRPGHAELWFRTDIGPAYPAFIKEPGKPLREVPATIVPYASGPNGFFNRDGSRVFSYPPFDGSPFPTLSVGDADDLTGTRVPLHPPGTRFTHYRELADGQLVVEAFFRGPDRNDIYLVDPTDGATKLLGKEGVVVAAGGRRVLAMTHRVDQAGDLESIDLDTGRSTPLAEEFVRLAFQQQPFDDPEPVRPGARVAYQFRARFASPHDGFWVTTLP
jgi:hypothetical protein